MTVCVSVFVNICTRMCRYICIYVHLYMYTYEFAHACTFICKYICCYMSVGLLFMSVCVYITVCISLYRNGVFMLNLCAWAIAFGLSVTLCL